jgi:alkaline phosphatase D
VTEPTTPERFPQSVASGDPRPDGIVLWTRAAPPPDGATVRVAYEIADEDDTAFARPLLTGTVQTGPDRDHTVKVAVRGPELVASTRYRYRFVAGGEASPTGHFRTLPAPEAHVERLRLATISCQDFTNGYYTALAHLAGEDVDYVLHLGDYIYETVPPEDGHNEFQGSGPRERYFHFPRDTPGDRGLEATTLADYRFAYRTYRSDPHLQRLHENFAMISTWDDHEFTNDGYGTHPSGTANPPDEPARRAAATRAWVEYTPAEVPYQPQRTPTDEVTLHRAFAFGDLVELVMTEERLHRDPHPCGEQTGDKYLTAGCDTVDDPGSTMLGQPQRDFLLDRLTGSDRTWKLWGNPVMQMQLKLLNTYLGADSLIPELSQAERLDGVYVDLDQWDGYQGERREIARRLRQASTENVVALTGDLHTFVAGYLKVNYDDPGNEGSNVVGIELVCGSVTSSNLAELAHLAGLTRALEDLPVLGALSGEAISALQTVLGKPSNPHIEFLDSTTHGYNVVELTHDELRCTMKAVDTVAAPQAELRTLASFRAPAGDVRIERTDGWW